MIITFSRTLCALCRYYVYSLSFFSMKRNTKLQELMRAVTFPCSSYYICKPHSVILFHLVSFLDAVTGYAYVCTINQSVNSSWHKQNVKVFESKWISTLLRQDRQRRRDDMYIIRTFNTGHLMRVCSIPTLVL